MNDLVFLTCCRPLLQAHSCDKEILIETGLAARLIQEMSNTTP